MCVGEKEHATRVGVQVGWSHDDDDSDVVFFYLVFLFYDFNDDHDCQDQARNWSTSTNLPLGGL